MAILESVTPLVEQLSIDEAFLDVARRAPPARHRRRDRGDCSATRVRAETGLTASVGVATTKFLAKLASDLAKPDGLLVVAPGTELAFLARSRSRGCGASAPRRSAQLDRMAMRTIGDVARARRSRRSSARSGASLGRAPARARPQRRPARGRARARGEVDRRRGDVRRRPAHARRVRARARAARRPRRDARCARAGYGARTVTLKIRFGDFETQHPRRARCRTRPTLSTRRRSTTARELLDAVRRRAAASGCSACRCSQLDDARRGRSRRARARRRRSQSTATRDRAPRRGRARGRRGARPLRSTARCGPATLVDDADAAEPMIRIGLVGCGHIGTVHAYALQQLADAGLVDAALDRDLRRRPRARRARSRGTTAASRAASLDELRRRASTSCGSARGPRRTSPRSRPRPTRGLRGLLREAARADLARLRARSPALLERVPHQVGLVLRYAPVFATRGRARRVGRLRPAARDDAPRRPVLPDPGHVRLDLAQGRRRTPAAARSSSTRSTTSTCCAGCSAIPSSVARPHASTASGTRASRTPPRSRSPTPTARSPS